VRGPQFTFVGIVVVLFVIVLGLAFWVNGDFGWPAAVIGVLVVIAVIDLVQVRHSIRRNYPLFGRLRWVSEQFRPEIQQYFVEQDTEGRPFDRNHRSMVYQRAKNAHAEQPFGTQLDVYAPGYEWFGHSLAPKPQNEGQFRVRLDGQGVEKPYDMSLLNVSAMSFGSLSSNAIVALNQGAKRGEFAHDTGEGGLSEHHRQGADLVWEIGTGYFGSRTTDGEFDPDQFIETSRLDQVKCTSIKLSQGAKPGLGGVMPAAKVTAEIAGIRGVPEGVKCVSPPYHSAFSTPEELLAFVDDLRSMSGGKPVGFKLCVGQPSEFLSICKAMVETGVHPQFILVDGAEGGTGAAPLEFEDHVGMPLTEGLVLVHNALVGTGLRDKIKIGVAGKIDSGSAMAARIAQGADYTNAARAMMLALGCIQAMRCETNTCPVGVATQNPRRVRGLVVPDKAERVYEFHRNTVASFNQLLAAMGLDDPHQLDPSFLTRRIDPTTIRTYAELYEWLETGELLTGARRSWVDAWAKASPGAFV
jgi:glutamate synthase domain-containing protein 2